MVEDGYEPVAHEKSADIKDRVTNLVFNLLNEFDIGELENLDYIPLVEAWCNRVAQICDGTDKDDELKVALKEYLFGGEL